jgi:hypothetical protein
MGSEYVDGKNPFRDFLLKSLEFGLDISDKKLKNEISSSFTYILKNVLDNPEDTVYLDFEIINIDNYYKIIGKNALSALWLSGILVDNTAIIMRNNTFVIGNRKYHYDNKTNELTYTIFYE